MNTRVIALSLFVFAIAGCDGPPQVADSSSWTIRPESDQSPITRQTDESALSRAFGSANVKRERIEIGEGETVEKLNRLKPTVQTIFIDFGTP